MIAVQGSLQVRNYEDKNGNKRTAYDVVADNVSFCGSKSEGNTFGAPRQDSVPAVSYQSADAGSFSVLPDDNSGFPFGADDDEGLPF
jgi:single-strand DNA-binding protein